MPLGGFVNFPNKDKKLYLKQGNTVLFMRTGFEDRINLQDEMLGMEQVKVQFEKSLQIQLRKK